MEIIGVFDKLKIIFKGTIHCINYSYNLLYLYKYLIKGIKSIANKVSRYMYLIVVSF